MTDARKARPANSPKKNGGPGEINFAAGSRGCRDGAQRAAPRRQEIAAIAGWTEVRLVTVGFGGAGQVSVAAGGLPNVLRDGKGKYMFAGLDAGQEMLIACDEEGEVGMIFGS